MGSVKNLFGRSGLSTIAVVTCITGCPNAAIAQEKQFNIPAQQLDNALREFSIQAEQPIIYAARTVQGLRGSEVKGRLPVERALKQLIGATNLQVTKTRDNVLLLDRAPDSLKLLHPTSITRPVPVAAPAEVQSAQPAVGLDEIVVTAQKREERLQDVPLAVTAVDNRLLTERGIANIAGLQQLVPNTTLNVGVINPTQFAPTIRGIGTFNSDPLASSPVAVSVDGVYLATVFSALVNTFDVERIEVLRGPQGILQGRNATGGAVNVTTRRPSGKFGARVQLGFGRFNEFQAQAAIEAPLVQDTLAMKLAFSRLNGGNYMRNLISNDRFGGVDTWSGRAGLLFTPSEKFTAYLTADFVRDRSPQPALRAANTSQGYPRPEFPVQTVPTACTVLGYCSEDAPYTARADYTEDSRADTYGFSLNAEFDAGFATISSISGYRHTKEFNPIDLDRLPEPIFYKVGSQNFTELEEASQEIRLSSNRNGGADLNGYITWMLGAYYGYLDIDKQTQFSSFGNPLPASRVFQKLDTYALFGRVEVIPIEPVTFYVGARQTWDKKKYRRTAPTTGADSDEWTNFSVEVGMNYKITPDHLIYARYSEGYIAGGFTTAGPIYASEQLTSYEVGFKTDWFNRRLRFNASAFHYDYSNLQRFSVRQVTVPPFFISEPINVGKATIEGVELELAAVPAKGLNLRAALGYLDARYDRFNIAQIVNGVLVNFDNSALRLPFAPKWTISGGIDYEFGLGSDGGSGTLTPSLNFQYLSSHTVASEDVLLEAQDGYAIVNASLRYRDPSGRYSVAIYGNNLTDKKYMTSAGLLGGIANYKKDGVPLTYGIRLSAEF